MTLNWRVNIKNCNRWSFWSRLKYCICQCALWAHPHADDCQKKKIQNDQCRAVSLIFSWSFFVCRQPPGRRAPSMVHTSCIHISYHPRISSTMCWRPPGIPLPGPLKSPLCLIWAYCQRNTSVFSLSSSPCWQVCSAPAVLASPELMQMRVCLIKGLIRLLFEYDMAY